MGSYPTKISYRTAWVLRVKDMSISPPSAEMFFEMFLSNHPDLDDNPIELDSIYGTTIKKTVSINFLSTDVCCRGR